MILGVSLRMLPAIFGLPRMPEQRAWWALGLLTAAVIGETALFLIYRWTGNHLIAAGLVPTWAAMTAVVLKKWLTGAANTTQAMATMAASRLAGRA